MYTSAEAYLALAKARYFYRKAATAAVDASVAAAVAATTADTSLILKSKLMNRGSNSIRYKQQQQQ